MIPVITIDGPSGTGKGTVGQLLAHELHWNFLDSGALYRVLGVAAEKNELPLRDTEKLVQLALHFDVEFIAKEVGDPHRVFLDGDDVTETIRLEKYGEMASQVGAIPEVRTALLARQRAFRHMPGLVTDGRDMGTVVFPDANLKIFLLASAEERVKRRFQQLKERGINVSLDTLRDEIARRDARDKDRAVSPLKPADDAIVVDTTELTVQQVLKRLLSEAKKSLKIK